MESKTLDRALSEKVACAISAAMIAARPQTLTRERLKWADKKCPPRNASSAVDFSGGLHVLCRTSRCYVKKSWKKVTKFLVEVKDRGKIAFHKQPAEIDLILAVVGELNTIVRNGTHWPVLYGAGMNVKTGEIFPASIPDKGPDIALRGARVLTDAGQQILDVYDCTVGLMRIGPFNYNPLRGVDLWLEQSDEFILQHLSTTPDIEPPHFVSMVRAMLKYIRDHPFPAVTVFRDNRPHYFRRDEHTGTWIPLGY